MDLLTWHVHGSYLFSLAHCGHDIYLPVREPRADGYGGRIGTFPWPDNVHEVPAERVRELALDAVIFQAPRNWDTDQHEILSPAQRRLPRIYVEHDPPRASPTDSRHHLQDPDVLLVHVTPFNDLMWDSGAVPTRVIEHGVVDTGARWTGELARGIVAVNHLARRGRRLGADVVARVSREVPLDLVGMGSEESGGLGEVPPPGMAHFAARYRFMFNPIRWTSLGLAVCEAMMAGIPIVGLATTEMAVAVDNGVSGWVDTDLDRLVAHMRRLLVDHDEARQLSAGAARAARRRFSVEHFANQWCAALSLVTGRDAGSGKSPSTLAGTAAGGGPPSG